MVGQILRALPEYFGFEAGIVDFCEAARKMKNTTYAAITDDGTRAGFLLLTMNNNMTAEIWVMGVLPEFHGHGIGKALLERAETESRKRGRRYIMARTIGPSQNDPNYLKTFNFYLHNGYSMLVEYDFVWKGDYCAFMVKKL